MGAYLKASLVLPQSVLATAREYNYSKANYLILARRNKQLQKEFPQVWADIQSCVHCADGRQPIEYARDLVASWLIEDYFLHILLDAGYEIESAGTDKQRRILSQCQVGADCDFQVFLEGRKIQVEFLCDYTGYWKKNGHLDLRDEKYKKLRSQHAFGFGVDILGKQAILLDFRQDIPGTRKISSHKPFGGKPAYAVPCSGSLFFVLSPEELSKHLRAAVLKPTA